MTPLAEYGMVGALGAALILREVLPFLAKRNGKNDNGHSGDKPPSYWEDRFDAVGDRIEKSFEQSLKILVVPVMEKTNDILRESRDDSRQQIENTQKLTEAIIKLTLRDEVREQMRRSANA